MNMKQVLANSKLLRKALALGVISKKHDRYCIVTSDKAFVKFHKDLLFVWCYEQEMAIRANSIKDIETAFKHTLAS